MSGRNFKERGMLMKQGYEQLDSLYRKVLIAQKNSDHLEMDEISGEYQNVVSSSENHKEIDYIVSIVKLKMSGAVVDKQPTIYHYVRGFSYIVFRFAYLSFAYLLPGLAVLTIKQI